ncbi:polyhydroxyalkanoic acid system family protein [Roseateles amylovorans]|jgi:putative polyhydroxyalkanoate system protein|uniref:Polyhydroxyalkanoic acid system family protein n=1 Tax=Roseateles amylovorans TaxID=2978473 RepID=A0ABY6AX87_9BURK|nr:polyhydroxyalkanoic acid system family protein [Roseateles amylovorans]UXH77497.1 polyhydroxyalkanoic acid system family protein [Roseateles amylovorans]
MADIHVFRAHGLGLARAREIAFSWAEEVEQRYGMACTIHEGEDSDTVEFVRSGVKGSLEVTGESFEMEATLGMLLGAFKANIESEIERGLDALLAKEAAASAAEPSKAAKRRRS